MAFATRPIRPANPVARAAGVVPLCEESQTWRLQADTNNARSCRHVPTAMARGAAFAEPCYCNPSKQNISRRAATSDRLRDNARAICAASNLRRCESAICAGMATRNRQRLSAGVIPFISCGVTSAHSARQSDFATLNHCADLHHRPALPCLDRSTRQICLFFGCLTPGSAKQPVAAYEPASSRDAPQKLSPPHASSSHPMHARRSVTADRPRVGRDRSRRRMLRARSTADPVPGCRAMDSRHRRSGLRVAPSSRSMPRAR